MGPSNIYELTNISTGKTTTMSRDDFFKFFKKNTMSLKGYTVNWVVKPNKAQKVLYGDK